MKSTKKIKYAKSDSLTEKDFEGGKFRMSMYIDLDVIEEIRKRAASRGLPYQTFINQHLRDSFLGNAEDERIRRIVREELSKVG